MPQFLAVTLGCLLVIAPTVTAKAPVNPTALAHAVSEISAENSAAVSYTLFKQLSASEREQFQQQLPEPHQWAFWKYRLEQALSSGELDDKQRQVVLKAIEVLKVKQRQEAEFQQQIKLLEQQAVEAFDVEDAKSLFSIEATLFKNRI